MQCYLAAMALSVPTILIVERDPSRLDRISAALCERGFGVDTATRLSTAFDWLKQHSAELIVIGPGLGETGVLVDMARRMRPRVKALFLVEPAAEDTLSPHDRAETLFLPLDEYLLLRRVYDVLMRDEPGGEVAASDPRPAEFAIVAAQLQCLRSRLSAAADAGVTDLARDLEREIEAAAAVGRCLRQLIGDAALAGPRSA